MFNRLSGFPTYQRAIAKVHLASCGAAPERLDRPLIAVVNSWNELVSGHVHLRQLADRVKDSIARAGGVPLEFNTIAICDGITQSHAGMKYVLASRELIADSIEAMLLGHGMFDGAVFLGSCDKIVPAMLMAAARVNLPTLLITGGPMRHEISPNENKAARQAFIRGEIDERTLLERSRRYYPGAGICPFLGTANTMCIVAETLGMTLPGMATEPALGEGQLRLVDEAGRTVLKLVADGLKPRDVMTTDAFHNAVTVTAAIGGSMNAVLHIPAIAAECGLAVTPRDFDRVSRRTPLVARVYPNSGTYATADLHDAGGVRAVLRALRPVLRLDAPTVNGHTLGENIAGEGAADGKVVRPFDDPFEPEGGIAVLYGSLAPGGAFVKSSAVPLDQHTFEGAAQVFESEEACVEAFYNGAIMPGAAVVIRNEGPGGGPGMREMHRVTELLAKIPGVAIVTDGRFSGASAGLAIGYLSPEAYAGGPIAFVESGDRIRVDIPNRRIDWLVSEETARTRAACFTPRVSETDSNFLRLYRATACDSAHGAVRRRIE